MTVGLTCLSSWVLQERLFRVVGLPMVENCMAGYNSCMFAYGQVSRTSNSYSDSHIIPVETLLYHAVCNVRSICVTLNSTPNYESGLSLSLRRSNFNKAVILDWIKPTCCRREAVKLIPCLETLTTWATGRTITGG